jgi:RNA polymerase sigma-70 factor (ECF subfamily)
MDIRDTTDPEDRLEMTRLAAGEETALDRLMDRHARRLYHYLLRLLQNESEAEELAQETFVRVFRNARSFKPDRSFAVWLYTIATNLVRDRVRRQTRRPQVSFEAQVSADGATLRDVLPGQGPSPADHAASRERVQAVRDAIANLPEELRLPLILSEFDDLSHAEIAAITGGTPKAVEMRLYRARQSLRQSLTHLLELNRRC